MGSLREKLQYLKESVDLMKCAEDNADWLNFISGNKLTTTRERIEFALECAKWFCHMGGNPWDSGQNTGTATMTLADGTVETHAIGDSMHFTLPPIVNTYHMELLSVIHMSKHIANYGFCLDCSKPTPAQYLAVELVYPTPKSLILNDKHKLCNKTVQNADNRKIFCNGLKFGKRVIDCHSNWFSAPVVGGWQYEIFVSVPEGFEGTVYLSKLPIKAECLVDIINNLADMSGTETVYELNLGSDNIAKLTEEQLAVAEAKGWIIS